MTPKELITEAEGRRDAGMSRAAERRPLHVLRGELALLDALLTAPGATATTDVIADDPRNAYADGGRWVGSVAIRLANAGIITEIACVRSIRPSRHRGRTGLYSLVDFGKAKQRRDLVCRLIAAHESQQPTETTLF